MFASRPRPPSPDRETKKDDVRPEMQAPQGAPEWANALSVRFESGASGQFVLYGNVHDRIAVGGRLVSIEQDAVQHLGQAAYVRGVLERT